MSSETINDKTKLNFQEFFSNLTTVIPLYNAMVGVHDIKARNKWGAL